jgi:hypothetical protein
MVRILFSERFCCFSNLCLTLEVLVIEADMQFGTDVAINYFFKQIELQEPNPRGSTRTKS